MFVCEVGTYLFFCFCFWYENVIESSIPIWPKHTHLTSNVFKLKAVAFESPKEIGK